MQVLEILEENGIDLYPEDLDFFEAELNTSVYSQDYVARCQRLILEIRTKKKQITEKTNPRKAHKKAEPPAGTTNGISPEILVNPSNLVPSAPQKEKPIQDRLEEISQALAHMRTASDYKTRFKKYLAGHPEIDEAFIDQHIALFQPPELAAVLMTMKLSEDFLEKYFDSLDPDKIARYQLFSEKFFIRHYGKMNAEIVLTKGKNKWCKKENRSSQLDVFLRLKGVRL